MRHNALHLAALKHAARCAEFELQGYPSGYGSLALSPPVTVSYTPLPQDGQGGRCFVDPTSSSLPQFVHRYVPADTSLPAGTGFAIVFSSLARQDVSSGSSLSAICSDDARTSVRWRFWIGKPQAVSSLTPE